MHTSGDTITVPTGGAGSLSIDIDYTVNEIKLIPIAIAGVSFNNSYVKIVSFELKQSLGVVNVSVRHSSDQSISNLTVYVNVLYYRKG